MFKRKHSYANFIEGVLIGGTFAAAATYLFGTPKGKKLQRKAIAKYKKLGIKAEHYLNNIKKVANSPIVKKLKKSIKRRRSKD